MSHKYFQDYYPDNHAHCYGCGRLNEEGLHLKSYWDGDESVCHYTPRKSQTGGFPGNIYGGLIASLIDCHSAASASAAKFRENGFKLGEEPLPRFVTAALKLDFLKPTPMGIELEVRAKVTEIKGRKVVLSSKLVADGVITAKGEAVMVQLPE